MDALTTHQPSGVAILVLVLPLLPVGEALSREYGTAARREKAVTEDQMDLAADILDHAFRQVTAST